MLKSVNLDFYINNLLFITFSSLRTNTFIYSIKLYSPPKKNIQYIILNVCILSHKITCTLNFWFPPKKVKVRFPRDSDFEYHCPRGYRMWGCGFPHGIHQLLMNRLSLGRAKRHRACIKDLAVGVI